MSRIIVVGTLWGDEGKGKIVDVLTENADVVVRAQGGNNAGHTILIGTNEFKLHLTPSGILQPHTECIMASGMVIDPEVLLTELRTLKKQGVQFEQRLKISEGAHVIFPYHKALDEVMETSKGVRAIGTTKRGIGPCYADKANRVGIRMGELVRPEELKSILESVLYLKNKELQSIYGTPPFDFEALYTQYKAYGEELASYIENTDTLLSKHILNDKKVVFEGAQGTYLDNTCGTYPYVTSSSTTAAGICVGAGVGPKVIDHVIGVTKAYATRVGNGPFPTELKKDETFVQHDLAREFGTTTGRKRSIGWFDGVLLKNAVHLNGLQSLALTKLDVLDELEEVKICVGYKHKGVMSSYMPTLAADFSNIEPVYESMPGWRSSTKSIQNWEELPQKALDYLNRIESIVGVPVSILSLGPERSQTLIKYSLFSRGNHCLQQV